VNKETYQHISDGDLLNRFYQSKDNAWIGILLQRYTLLLLGVCMKYLKNEEEAKDAVQQVFLKAIGELEKYKVDYFKSWIYMIARNHCLMQLRNKHEKIKSVEDDWQLKDESATGYETAVEKEQLISAIESSLGELNKEQKTCVTLFYLNKKTYQQISAETGFSLMQVKSFIQNGKRNLKILVEKKMH
jgi:RNA polymerase sigma-70 factor (ECF subfamily)